MNDKVVDFTKNELIASKPAKKKPRRGKQKRTVLLTPAFVSSSPNSNTGVSTESSTTELAALTKSVIVSMEAFPADSSLIRLTTSKKSSNSGVTITLEPKAVRGYRPKVNSTSKTFPATRRCLDLAVYESQVEKFTATAHYSAASDDFHTNRKNLVRAYYTGVWYSDGSLS
ncbi:hypothetical protein PUN28_011836 [Cardiocondyla obscurior]|uniref:Uncharacterized protein n=1 Tax=Cardiocondyla obscurior TaxID=286306 RepID=A0AAW2FIB4_9HYME